ncbi:MAG: undecaprenyl-diphosphate phosphatase [Candidatus Pacebacteria bacterium]|nr:undecaprenyl-diphosphate phosphatase [Candidatus Paceibacterota bacterium]
MTIIHAIILGIVEGITEFLPISSTGHMILAGNLLHIPQTEFLKTFEIFIQLGAILAVVVLFWKRLTTSIESWKRIIIGFIPTGIIGLALYKVVKTYLLGNSTVVLWSLLLGGIAILVFELWYKRQEGERIENIESISYKKSALVGLAQAVAIVPGVSRSAATIVGGLLLGIKRETIVEFSFLLAIPTMLAASGLDLLKSASSIQANQIYLLAIGFVVSFVVALGSIKFLLNFVKKHTFIPFAIYRIAVAILFWILIVR